MKIKIQYVADQGDLKRERLVLSVRQDADIGDFVLLRTGFLDEDVTTEIRNAFWFPYDDVRARDFVLVYSKEGGSHRKTLQDGRHVHIFYWGESAPLWKEKNVAPVLLYAPQWISKPPDQLARRA